MRADVGDARQHEQSAVVLQYYVLIFENRQTEPPNLLCPRTFAGVILVIAGDEIGAVTRSELRQGRRVLRQLLHRTIHQITSHGDQVGLQVVHSTNDAFDEPALDGWPDVYVADLRDRKSVQGLREVREPGCSLRRGAAGARR